MTSPGRMNGDGLIAERGRMWSTALPVHLSARANPQLSYPLQVLLDIHPCPARGRRICTNPGASPVARVVVDVMPKQEILDPQGQAVAAALPRLGFEGISEVRQGKRFELEVADDVDDAALDQIAETLLANPVIENFVVRRVEA
ncbi:hypothetical protein GCM10020366_61960 [Saccharopolyspora gregorii]|uniref:Phosphoribosylformylglycinamidine synthase subunit PurS n=1 Tax=Saccharopolyspora gregorii TaxID=33914 RepID=A0ABP6S092_9PSEU